MKKLSGVVVPVITPFTEGGVFDEESMEKLCRHLIGRGITCLYPNGTTGEMMYLSTDERRRAAEIVVRAARGQVPVFVQVGAWNQEQTVGLAKHAVEIGADGIGVVTPSFFKLSDGALLAYYKAVSESVPQDYPIYLYSIPQCAVNDITPGLAQRIADECPNVIGIKYSYPDMSRIQQLMMVREETFSVLCGPDELFDVTVCAGGDGTVSGNAQCIPEHYAAIWDALQRKDFETAKRIQRRTNRLNDILCEYNNIAHYKAVLKAEGIIAHKTMRKPMEELSDIEEQRLMERLKELNYHCVEL